VSGGACSLCLPLASGTNPPLEALWQPLLISLLLVGTVLHPDRPVGRFLESSPLRWVGRMSYSLYLWE